jgi:pimeloyl-ACP methyl ester carboxylesterase
MRATWLWIVLIGCGGAETADEERTGGGAEVLDDRPRLSPIYAPGKPDFYATPWPSDLRMRADGFVDLEGFPDSHAGAVAMFRNHYESHLRGFSTMPVVVVPFHDLPADMVLPSPAESLSPMSPIQLLSVAPEHCGERVPIEVVLRSQTGDRFLPDHGLLAAPVPGFSLRGGETYALVVRSDLGANQERAGTASPDGFDLSNLPMLSACLEEAGLSEADVAVASELTTQEVLDEMRLLRDHAALSVPAPQIRGWAELPEEAGPSWVVFRGVVDLPIYQEGSSPYMLGGGFVFEDGQPVVQRWEEVAFTVSFDPSLDRTADVVIWQSGARASLSGWADEPLAEELRQEGAVIVKFLQQFHGERNVEGGDPDLHTYNYLNPASGRSVLRQEAVDVSSFVRVIREALPGQAGMVDFDAAHLSLVGHSQGAEVGALLAAVEPEIDALLLHGVGTYVSETIVHRTDPFDVPELLGEMLGITSKIDRFHPIIHLVQMGADVVDPGNYLRAWKGWEAHPDGSHVLLVNGWHDQDVFYVSMDAMTIGADAAPIDPMGWEVDPHGVWSVEPEVLPLMGNRTSVSGAPLTLASYLSADGDHYSLYELPEVRALGVGFLMSAADGVPEVR